MCSPPTRRVRSFLPWLCVSPTRKPDRACSSPTGRNWAICTRRSFPSLGLDSLADSVSDHVGGKWLNLWRSSDAIGGQVVPSLGSRNWEVKTGKGHSRYELTPEFCAARKTQLTGAMDRPADADIARCWSS